MPSNDVAADPNAPAPVTYDATAPKRLPEGEAHDIDLVITETTMTVAPGFVQATWMGFFAPRTTPEEVRARVHAAVTAVLKDPAIVPRLRDLGFEPVGGDGAAFAKLFDETVRTFADIASERQIVAGD